MTDETIVTDPNTGGQKGRKLCRIGSIDPLALYELGTVAGHAEETKYDRLNYMRGYDWSLSFDACLRHLLLFWNGASIDADSGRHHLAHAAWHCLCMLTFSLRGIGNDDRYNPKNSSHYIGELDL